MDIQEKVKQVLERTDVESPQVTILENRGTRVLVEVVSSSFEAMDEGDRQSLVWERLLTDLSDYDSSRVEFVYTNSPSEHDSYVAIANGTASPLPGA